MNARTRNIMTKNLITIPMGSSIAQAYEIMEKGNFRHLPVVDPMDDVVGILSHRDLNFIKNPEAIPVEYVMSAPVIYVEQQTPLREVISRMLRLKISCLMVSDEKDNAVGIITTDDLLAYLSSLLEEEGEKKSSILDLVNLRTVGDVANQLSNVGI